MARVQYSGAITDIKGSINGWTFQHNNSGKIIRTRPTQRRFRSIAADAQKQSTGKFLALWQGLNNGEKILWNDFAFLYTKTNIWGEVKKLTGWDWFFSINYNLDLQGLSLLKEPPTHTLPIFVPSYSLVAEVSTLNIVFNPTFSTGNSGVIIYTSKPTTAVSAGNRGMYRLTKILPIGSYDSIDITADYSSTHGFDYSLLGYPFKFNIFAIVKTIEQTSGIASVGLTAITKKESAGIGYYIIEDTFIIS